MRKNVCLIGYGYWGKIVSRYLQDSEKFELVGICDPFYEESVDLDVLLHGNKIDAAIVCTPVHTHYDVVKKLLQNGVAVFCEKPLCKTVGETEELISFSSREESVLYTDYIYTVSKSIGYVKEHLGELGEVEYIDMSITQFGNFYADADVFDVIGVHMLSVLAYLFDVGHEDFRVKSVDCIKKTANDIIQSANLRFELGDVNGTLNCSLCDPTKSRRFEVVCKNGAIVFDMLAKDTVKILKYVDKGESLIVESEEAVQYDEGNNLRLTLEAFANCIDGADGGKALANNHEVAVFVANALEEIALVVAKK